MNKLFTEGAAHGRVVRGCSFVDELSVDELSVGELCVCVGCVCVML